MCDWDAEEYAEYLLWAEAARARARIRTPSPKEPRLERLPLAMPVPNEVAEA